MKRFAIITIAIAVMAAAMLYRPAISIAAQKSGGVMEKYGLRNEDAGKKAETDVLFNAIWEVSKKVPFLPGLQNAKRVAVMIVREPATTGSMFDISDSQSNVQPSSNSPLAGLNPLSFLQGFFEPSNIVLKTTGNTPVGEHGYSHSPLYEDLIINALVQSGKFEVIEASESFRGPLFEIMAKDAALMDLINDPTAGATIGKMLGVDTVVIGSLGISQSKRLQKHRFFIDNQYFIFNTRLNVRTIDVESNTITSADTFTGSDSVKTATNIRPSMLETAAVALLSTFLY
jgi:hypothetical protein